MACRPVKNQTANKNEAEPEHFWITGLVPAVFTPLQEDGSLNLNQIPPLVDHLLADGVGALYVCGGTGEGPSLTTEERMQVAEAYVQAADGRLPIIVQVGHNSLVEAQRLARHAQRVGAAAISAVPPFFYQVGSLEALLDTLAMILEAAPELPFYYYHIPRLTHFELDMVKFLEKSTSQHWQARSVEMVRCLSRYGLPSQNGAALKTMMRLIGLDCGPVRLPQVNLTAEEIEALHTEMESIGFFDWARKRPSAAGE